MVVELDGRLDESRLAAAVRAVVEVEPVLACRVQDRFFRPRWKPVSRVGPESTLRVIEADDVAGEIRGLLVEDLDPRRGPLFRVGLVRGERDTVVVNLDHTAGDAASARSLTYLLSALYGDPNRYPAPDLGTYFERRGFRALEPLMPKVKAAKGGPPASPFPGTCWGFPWRGGVTEFRKGFS